MASSNEHRNEGVFSVGDEADVRRIIRDRRIEFLFAQFVDMHSQPSAKVVPALRVGSRAAARQPGSTPAARSGATTCCRALGAIGAIGAIGDRDYSDCYATVKRREWQAAHEQITQWGMDHYTCSSTHREWDRHEEHRCRL